MSRCSCEQIEIHFLWVVEIRESIYHSTVSIQLRHVKCLELPTPAAGPPCRLTSGPLELSSSQAYRAYR